MHHGVHPAQGARRKELSLSPPALISLRTASLLTQLYIGGLPGLFEALLDLGRGLGLVLRLEALSQTIERPSVLRPMDQVFATDLFGSNRPVGREQNRAQPLADRQVPVRRLIV